MADSVVGPEPICLPRLTRIGGGTDEMMREIVATQLDVEDPEATSLLHEYAARDTGCGPQ